MTYGLEGSPEPAHADPDATELRIARIEPAYRQVAEQLRSQILDGQLRLGQRLPSESKLSALFGVSRSTTREALRALASQRLIDTSRGVNGGNFVAQPSMEHIQEYLETSIGLLTGGKHVSVQHLLEARELLEVPAAALAAARRTDEDIEHLRSALKFEQNSPATTLTPHKAVHQAILVASHNPLLSLMTGPVFRVLRTRFLRDRAQQSFWRDVDQDHIQIIDQIESRDVKGVETAMRRHLETLRALYESLDV